MTHGRLVVAVVDVVVLILRHDLSFLFSCVGFWLGGEAFVWLLFVAMRFGVGGKGWCCLNRKTEFLFFCVRVLKSTIT